MIFKYVAPPNSPNITSVDIDVVNAVNKKIKNEKTQKDL